MFTLDEVVASINAGPVQGFEDHTAERKAAEYALDAIDDIDWAEYPIREQLEAHLDTLGEAGAMFNRLIATEIALIAMLKGVAK